MAVSYLLKTIKNFVDSYNATHADKKINWLPSRDGLIRTLDRQLDSGQVKVEEAMTKIRKEFHKEFVEKKVDEFSFFRAIEKETRYRLNK